jgi:putative Ca2+/H+ antiporter (TMEM165/GDT1 family)
VLVLSSGEDIKGLQSGDVIQRVGGAAVESPRDVMRALRDKDAGSQLKFDLMRDKRAQAVIGDGAEVAPLPFMPPPPPPPAAAPRAPRTRRPRRRRLRAHRARPARAAPPAPPPPPPREGAAGRRRRKRSRRTHRPHRRWRGRRGMGSDRAAGTLDCRPCARRRRGRPRRLRFLWSRTGNGSLLLSTLTVALAEIGDKTQLLALLLAARYRKPWPIIFGILAATLVNPRTAPPGWAPGWRRQCRRRCCAGAWCSASSPSPRGRWCPTSSMKTSSRPKLAMGSVFMATLVAFFLVEIGDKTQVATVVLAARCTAAVAGGHRHHARHAAGERAGGAAGRALRPPLPLRAARWTAAALFAALALWVAWPAAALTPRRQRLCWPRSSARPDLSTLRQSFADLLHALREPRDELLLELGADGEVLLARLRLAIASC